MNREEKIYEVVLAIAGDKFKVMAVSEKLGFPLPDLQKIPDDNHDVVLNTLADVYSVLLLKEALKSEKNRLTIKRLWEEVKPWQN